MKKAILAIDLSRATDLLVDCAPQFGALGIEHITLFHSPVVSFNYMEYSGYSMMVHIEARMINLRNKLNDLGFKADFVIKEGLPSQEIIDYASRHPKALLILGSKGFGFARRNLIGSTTLRVIQQSKNPVLMIRIKNAGKNAAGEDECALENKNLLNQALFVSDFSPNSQWALKVIQEHLAGKFHHLGVMHVQDIVSLRHHQQETIERFNCIDSERLVRIAASLEKTSKLPVNKVLTTGMVVPEILREAKINQVSMLIMGTHGRSFFSSMVLGSTTSQLIQLVESNCLLVPMPDDEKNVTAV